MTKTRGTATLAAVVAASLALGAAAPPAHASGGTPSDDQYGGVLGEQSGPGASQGGEALPVTGINVVLLLGAGTGLTAAGVAARRMARGA
jgi:hypothetical protein